MPSTDQSLTYEQSGVSINAQDLAISAFRQRVEMTHGPEVLAGVGSFGAAFAPDLTGLENPVLVSSTDGVGTKVRLHARFGTHAWAGRDLVAAVVNDLAASGARPLFFLDYIACNKVDPEVISQLVGGMAAACSEINCALIGGEIAEMGDLYQPREYDLAGFAVGLLDRRQLEAAGGIEPGDVVVGIASSGVHCNGFSLVRRLFEAESDEFWNQAHSLLEGSLKDALLAPTLCYAALASDLAAKGLMKAGAHISGGGLTDNLPRAVPAGLAARIQRESIKIPAVFDIIQRTGHVEQDEMWRVFNMGVGFCVLCSPGLSEAVIQTAAALGFSGRPIGEILSSTDGRQLVWAD